MPEKSPRLWCYSPSGGALIWKIMFLEPDLVVCENRLPEVNKTFFSCLSLPSGSEILKSFSLNDGGHEMAGEGWMTGLETTRNNLFYIHGYQAGSPEHAGIWAIDPVKAAAVWTRPDAAFVANLEEGMLVYAAGSFAGLPERNYMLLACMTGKVLEVIGENTQRVNALRSRSLSDEKLQKVVLPLLSGTHMPDVKNRDTATPERSGAGFYEYIAHAGLIVTVTHKAGEGGKGFDAVIRVLRNGVTVYEDMLARSTGVPCMNYFLLRGVTLYYIRNMNELISVSL